MDINQNEITLESLKLKVENQSKLIKELTTENEELYHQYNHLIIRNGKMLKRVDDLQKIISDLHIRIEELQLINGNMMDLNDKLRSRREVLTSHQPVNAENKTSFSEEQTTTEMDSEFDMEELYQRWKSYPGQIAQNGPNMKKQISMLIHLYKNKSLRAADLFNKAGVGGVTGARYVGTLKKFGMIVYTGARKKGHYEITQSGRDFLANKEIQNFEIRETVSSRAATYKDSFSEKKTDRPEIDMDLNDL